MRGRDRIHRSRQTVTRIQASRAHIRNAGFRRRTAPSSQHISSTRSQFCTDTPAFANAEHVKCRCPELCRTSRGLHVVQPGEVARSSHCAAQRGRDQARWLVARPSAPVSDGELRRRLSRSPSPRRSGPTRRRRGPANSRKGSSRARGTAGATDSCRN